MRLWRKPWVSVVALVVALCVGGTAAFAFPAWKSPDPAAQLMGQDGGAFGLGVSAKGQGKGLLKFRDLQGHWSEEAVTEASVQGLIYGYPDFNFRPNKPVTHLEALVMLARVLAQSPQVRQETQARIELRNRLQFRHKIPVWALDSLAVAVEQGLVTEAELVDLRPNQPAKRWEIARFLVRALNLENQVEAANRLRVQFRDAAAIPPGIAGYINLVFKKQLMVGVPGGLFLPQKPVTRAEMGTLLLRLQELLKDIQDDLREVVERYYVVGTIEAVGADKIIVKKEDGTSVTLKVYDDAYIFRHGRRLTVADLKVGDEIKAFVKNGEALFIRVLQSPERKRET